MLRNIIRWACVLCIVSIILLCIGCASSPASAPNPTIAADWDECHLYWGLERKEIVLDIDAQNRLGDLIEQYPLTETDNTPIPTEEILFGGPYIAVVFVKDGVTCEWSFNINRFHKTVTDGDTVTKTHYEPNSALLAALNDFC